MSDTNSSYFLERYDIIIFPRLLRHYQALKFRHSTKRGQIFILLTMFAGVIGIDPQSNLVFALFSVCFSLLITSFLFKVLTRLNLKIDRQISYKTTVGESITYPIIIRNQGRHKINGMLIEEIVPYEFTDIIHQQENSLLELPAGDDIRLAHQLTPQQRGIFTISGIKIRTFCPLGLLTKEVVIKKPLRLAVFPKVYPIDRINILASRSYQPGGIPLASKTGDSMEFLGLREYRRGDSLRDISWKASARQRKPIVREYLDEYFNRIAIVLDTQVKNPSNHSQIVAFEASVSLAASLLQHLVFGEYVIDMLATGQDLLELSLGRSLSQFENALELLACVEPGNNSPMKVIDPYLQEILHRLSALILVTSDFDEETEKTYQRLRKYVKLVKLIVVREQATTLPLPDEEFSQRISPSNLAEEILCL